MADRLATAEEYLRRAEAILAHPNNLQGEEWALLASLVGEADLLVRQARAVEPDLAFPLLDEVFQDFRDLTKGFTDPVFLRSSKAGRRQNKTLFGRLK